MSFSFQIFTENIKASETLFEVLRVGSDIRVVCTGCGRDLVLPREKLEKAIRRIRPAASEGSVSPDHE